jgi:transposase
MIKRSHFTVLTQIIAWYNHAIMTREARLVQVTATLEATLIRLRGVEAENLRLTADNASLRCQLAATGASVDLVLENASLQATIAALTEKMEAMNFRMAQMARRIFGRSSEPHHPDQQVLDEIMRQIVVENALVPDDSTATPGDVTTGSTGSSESAEKTAPKTRKANPHRKKGRGRLVLPDHLEIEKVVLDVPEAERRGPDGQLLPKVGVEVTWKLDYMPAWFRRLRIERPIYKLPYSGEPRIIAPPMACIVPHGLPTDQTVAMALVEKYDFHCPLYRQETKFERAGIDISRATLMNWVRHGAEALAPIHQAIGASILTSPVIGLDDTWIDVLDPGAGKTHQSRLWGYCAEDQFYCEYRRSRAGQWPAEFLAGYNGTVMADAYAGHHRLFVSGLILWAACMAHARRKFEEAMDAGEKPASQAMDYFTLLYQLEEEIADDPPDVRRIRRQAIAVPLLDKLEALLTTWVTTQRHSSGLYGASAYTLKIFPQLRTYTKDGKVPIDNNALERNWRQPSLSRKNCLFVGSDRGGNWAATMFSITQSCRLIGLDPFRYLLDIFAELHTGRKDYGNLRPKAWAGRLSTKAAS